MATTEDHPLRPASVYGISKRDQEELVLVLGRAYGIETVALRYLNVYGPRQALGNPYTGVAAIFAARLLSGRAPRVFEDGGQIRDLVHVSDVVRATAAAMDAGAAAGGVFNVATGRQVRVGRAGRADRRRAGLGRWRPRSPASSAPATSATASPTRRCATEVLGFTAGDDARHGHPRAGRAGWRARAPTSAATRRWPR